MRNALISPWSTLLAVVCTACVLQVPAADTFVLDPAQSQITLDGTLAGTGVDEQRPGSLTSRVAGTLVVEVTPDTIHFPGGSVLDVEINETGDLEPGEGGAAGSAPADFAARVSLPIGTGVAALRNVVLDTLTAQPVDLASGTFEAKDIQFFFPEGGSAMLDYRVSTFFGNEADGVALEGYATNAVSEAATLVDEGGLRTLTIPLNAQYSFMLLTSGDSTLTIGGQLVATAPSGSVDLSLGEVRVEGGNLIFSWPSEDGQTFTIWQASALGEWVAVEQDYPAQPGGTTTWSVQIQNEGTAFFQIEL